MRAAEIFEQAQTLTAAFFGMKLSREDIVAGDNGGEIDAVVANAGDKIVAAVAGFDRVRMDKIKSRPSSTPAKNGCGFVCQVWLQPKRGDLVGFVNLPKHPAKNRRRCR